YAKMLGERIERHHVVCWLVNTGWTGGPYGVGHRMNLKSTRAMVRAALAGQLDSAPTRREPVFGLEVPLHVSGVAEQLLDTRKTWTDPAAYDAQAGRLAALFRKNFEQFAHSVSTDVRAAGPTV
ncbi:MAG TPA: phosphoenolpyruvate carboxykinase (ATP), partial [Gemmatimonadales bacterium]|nr:phosphoenolpyruvate carboxykinase (ATP) [Gemmatimonadales bacterium]